jgi:hypothetical protein
VIDQVIHSRHANSPQAIDQVQRISVQHHQILQMVLCGEINDRQIGCDGHDGITESVFRLPQGQTKKQQCKSVV